MLYHKMKEKERKVERQREKEPLSLFLGPKRPQPVIKEVNSDQQSGRGNKSKKPTHTLIKSKGNKFKSKRR